MLPEMRTCAARASFTACGLTGPWPAISPATLPISAICFSSSRGTFRGRSGKMLALARNTRSVVLSLCAVSRRPRTASEKMPPMFIWSWSHPLMCTEIASARVGSMCLPHSVAARGEVGLPPPPMAPESTEEKVLFVDAWAMKPPSTSRGVTCPSSLTITLSLMRMRQSMISCLTREAGVPPFSMIASAVPGLTRNTSPPRS